MTLRTLRWLVPMTSICVVGCSFLGGEGTSEADLQSPEQQQQEEPAAEAAKAPEPAAEMPSPAAICVKVVSALAAKDAAALSAEATAASAEAIKPEAVTKLSGTLAGAECGEEAVEGEAATVKVTAGEKTVDFPFVKADDVWKFDYVAYVAANPEQPAPKAKGRKGKKKRKGKRRRAK